MSAREEDADLGDRPDVAVGVEVAAGNGLQAARLPEEGLAVLGVDEDDVLGKAGEEDLAPRVERAVAVAPRDDDEEEARVDPGRKLRPQERREARPREAAVPAEAAAEADRVVLLDIYPSRETDTLGVSADDILALMPDRQRVRRVGQPADAAAALLDAHAAGELAAGAVVLTLGAGDVTTIGGMVLRALGD